MILPSLALALSTFSAALEDPFERFTLANGTRAAVWTLDGGQRSAAFVFLPFGLLDDDPGRTQWSHLLEHALLRASHPDALTVGDVAINGETLGNVVRLEAHGGPDDLDEALAILGDCLDNRDYSKEMLAREDGRIGGELDSTSTGGFTGKWALAALGQVARHGAESVELRGAVADVDAAQLAAYAEARVRVGPELFVVVVGPNSLEEVRKALAATLGALPAAPQRAERPTPASAPAPGAASAVWDLDRRHYLEWYPLPGDGPADRVAHELLARLVSQAFMLSKDPVLRGGGASASVAEVVPGQRALVVSVGEAGGSIDVDAIGESVRSVLDPFGPGGKAWRSARGMVPMLRTQLTAVPDVAALRKQWEGRRGSELIELNVALGLVNLELSTGLTRTQLEEALAGLGAEGVESLAPALSAGARRSLVLNPER